MFCPDSTVIRDNSTVPNGEIPGIVPEDQILTLEEEQQVETENIPEFPDSQLTTLGNAVHSHPDQVSSLLDDIVMESVPLAACRASVADCQAVWKRIVSLLMLTNDFQILDAAHRKLEDVTNFLEGSVQGGRRLKEFLPNDLGYLPIKENTLRRRQKRISTAKRLSSHRYRGLLHLSKVGIASQSGKIKRVKTFENRTQLKRRLAIQRKRNQILARRSKHTKQPPCAPQGRVFLKAGVRYRYNKLGLPVREDMPNEPCSFVNVSQRADIYGSRRIRGECKFFFILFPRLIASIASFFKNVNVI